MIANSSQRSRFFIQASACVLWLATCVFACSNEEAPATDDEPRPPAPRLDSNACAERPQISSFELLPGIATIPRFETQRCVDDVASLLVVNTTDQTVHVERISAGNVALQEHSSRDNSAAFSIVADGLPRDLGPLEVIPIEVKFSAKMSAVYGISHLVVTTDTGCQKFGQLIGVSVAENESALVMPGVVDFGVVAAGESSAALDIDFVFARGSVNSTVDLSIVSTSAPDVFEVVKSYEETISEACEKSSVSVRINAFENAGLVTADLFVETQAHSITLGDASGIGTIPLRGVIR